MTDSPNPRKRMMVHGLTPARKPPPAAAAESPARPTTPAQRPTAPFLVGHGYDIHRLEKKPGRLVLAGVTVSEEFSVIAHTDGDVIYHALTDAMIGALGLGDLGELFSNADLQWKDAASHIFVEELLIRARRVGYRVSNVDITLMLERPQISPHREQMTANIRQLLEPVSVVNLKAGTNEGCDAIGRGEAVAAHAVVLLVAQRAGTP